jgi:hypothetical protein
MVMGEGEGSSVGKNERISVIRILEMEDKTRDDKIDAKNPDSQNRGKFIDHFRPVGRKLLRVESPFWPFVG